MGGIPDSGGVYSACMLKNVGTVRLIDKSLPPGNLMSHCKPALEVEIMWNQQGRQGLQGLQGPPGPQGEKGDQGDPGNLALAGRSCASDSFVTGFDNNGDLVCAAPGGGGGGGGGDLGDLLVSPLQLNFPPQPVGTRSFASVITLTNTGSAPIAPGIVLTGANATDFGVGECSAISPQGTCDLLVDFAPTGVGQRTAQLVMQRPNGQTITVWISGDGIAP